MTTLHITRGLPASGKTTLAREWVARDPASRARVNRDDLRAMAHSGVFIKGETEKAIIAARDALIVSLLKRGIDVFNDDTNLRSGTVRDLQKLAGQAGAEFRVWDLTHVDLETCIARDAERSFIDDKQPVGEHVIRDMHTRYLRGKKCPLPVPEAPAGPVVKPYVPVSGPPTILVDLDGTVALMNGRSPYDESRVGEDLPNHPVIETVRALYARGHLVVFMSGRTEDCREATEKWLAVNVPVYYQALHMRASGDTRKDAIVKYELFDRHIRDNYNVRCVFDDRSQVVQMWRSLGLTVFQVADGDF